MGLFVIAYELCVRHWKRPTWSLFLQSTLSSKTEAGQDTAVIMHEFVYYEHVCDVTLKATNAAQRKLYCCDRELFDIS